MADKELHGWGVFGPGSLVENMIHLLWNWQVIAVQQVSISFWYLMDSKRWQEILLSATR